MKYQMEKKILDAAGDIAAKCVATDLAVMLGGGKDPKMLESFTKFVNALNEAEEKKIYSALKSALRKLKN